MNKHVKPYWIDHQMPAKLGTMPHPMGGPNLKEAMSVLRDNNVDVLVSALPDHNTYMLGLDREGEEAETLGLKFYNLPIDNMNVPTAEEMSDMVEQLNAHIEAGESVAAHCYAGIGRATLIAASVLICRGMTTDEAINLISLARGLRVPDTTGQVMWLQDFEHYCKKKARS